jgi:hypothetical protein
MSIRDFLKSRLFWKQIGLALVIGVAILIILIIWLNIYTRHGQSRPTPEVRGLSIKEAKAVASKNRMRFQVIDSVYTAFVPRGCVAEQILPGHRVRERRMIKVTINAFSLRWLLYLISSACRAARHCHCWKRQVSSQGSLTMCQPS